MSRVLYVPNERANSRQIGFRRALGALQRLGAIDVSVFSLLLRQEQASSEATRSDLVERCRQFRPDVILIQHPVGSGLTEADMKEMRKASSPVVVYHEGDPYGRRWHSLPTEARMLAANADVVFTVGSGVFTENMVRHGARDVRWTPHTVDLQSWPALDRISTHRPYDVVMIANRSRARLPIRNLPGARGRRKFAARLQEAFGERLLLVGKGWEGQAAVGPRPYEMQADLIRSAWISANWDHYATEPRYFSDRLPISLAVGSIHATTLHPQYDSIFPDPSPFLILEKDPFQLVDAVRAYLDKTTYTDRLRQMAAGTKWAADNLRQDAQLVSFLQAAGINLDFSSLQSDFDLPSTPIEDV